MQNELLFTGTMPPRIEEVKIYFSQKACLTLKQINFPYSMRKKGAEEKKGATAQKLEEYSSKLDYVRFVRQKPNQRRPHLVAWHFLTTVFLFVII